MELVLPTNSVEIHESEKKFIDGGFAVSKDVVASAINVAISAVVGGIGVGSVTAYIRRVGKEEAKKIFTRTVKSKLKAIGCAGAAAVLGKAVDFALDYSDIGGAIADYLDAHDTYPNNGWIG